MTYFRMIPAVAVAAVAGGCWDFGPPELGPDPCSHALPAGRCTLEHARFLFDRDDNTCVEQQAVDCVGVNVEAGFGSRSDCENTCLTCEELEGAVAPESESVAIWLRNESDAPVYVRSYTEAGAAVRSAPFEISRGGVPLITHPTDCDRAATCERQIEAACAGACEEAAEYPAPIMVAPGRILPLFWSGLYLDGTTLPLRCIPSECGAELECSRWEEAGGSYTARMYVTTALTECEDCTCEPNEDGWCYLPADQEVAYGEFTELEGAFSYPTEERVELVFEG